MEFLRALLHESWVVVAEAAPWLLVGFLFAGLLKAFVPGRLVARQLGGDRLRSVLLASLYGAPIPLCSCSVIPTASALRSAGASKGATASFLISTPETGVDSISVTYALLDPWMTVLRPLAAFASAVLTGTTVNVLVRRGWDGPEPDPVGLPEASACCGADEGDAAAHDHASAAAGDHGHTHEASLDLATEEASATVRARAGVRYAFVDLLDDLTPVLVLGLLLSGAIAALVPADFFSETVPSGLPAMLLMLVVGTPLYVCATASTPIAAAMIAKGLDPGAALVFLLVGPATNVTTLLVVGRMLGRRILGAYLFGVVGVALATGFAANALYASSGIDLGAVVAAELHGETSTLGTAAGIVLLALLAISAVRIRLDRILAGWLQAPLRRLSRAPRTNGGALLLFCALAVAASSCRTVTREESTNSGTRAVRRAQATAAWEIVLDGERFGRVVRFEVEGWPGETRFVVQNPYAQDLGMIDALGRAFRYRPHEEPLWLGSGTLAEGTATVLGLTGTPRLEEAPLVPTDDPSDPPGGLAPARQDGPLR